MKPAIYLDYAAATPMDESVFAAMQPFFMQQFYNPSATYLAAQKVHKQLEAARAGVAHWLGSRPNEIVFTAGSTEANNLVIHGVMQQFLTGAHAEAENANCVVSTIEHESVLESAKQYNYKLAPVQANGVIDLAQLENLIDDQTVLISVMYANNEIGTVQPIHKIGQLAQAIRKKRRAAGNKLPLYVHTDAAQAAAYLDLHVARLGVDFLTLNGGKMYGPKQSGVLFADAHARLVPLVYGGGQERGLRSGTENIAGRVGLATALNVVQSRRHQEQQRLKILQDLFFNLLEGQFGDAITINGSRDVRLPNNVHVTFTGHDNERILMELDEKGIMCAAGSACSASNEEPSHVLRALGLTDAEAQASIRFTMGIQTTEADIRTVVAELAKLIRA